MRGASVPLKYLLGDEGLRMFKKGLTLLPNSSPSPPKERGIKGVR